MSTYDIKTKEFIGPIEKLLELIENRKLDITRLSLSEVTADFLNYVRTLTSAPPRLLSNFLVVAARLVLIKSKALLPTLSITEEEEEDIRNLEQRLRLYKRFKEASKQIDAIWKSGTARYGRELLGFSSIRVFYPGDNLTKMALAESLRYLLKSLERFTELHTETIQRTLITLEQKMKELLAVFEGEKKSTSFRALAKNREETILLFLAVLHLIKDQLLYAEQDSQFSDIIVRSGPSGVET